MLKGDESLESKERYYRNITAATALLHDLGKFIRRSKIDKNYKHWEHSYKYIKMYFKGYNCVDEDTVELIANIAALHHKDELNKTINQAKKKNDKKRLNQLNEIKETLNKLNTEKYSNEFKIVKKVIVGDLDSCSERKLYRDDEDSVKIKKELHVVNAQSEYSPLMNTFCILNNTLCSCSKKIKYDKYTYFEPNSLLEFKNKETKFQRPAIEISPKIKYNLRNFENEIKQLTNFKELTFEDCINLWNFLLKKYTSFICSSKWERLKEISLYNHTQTTAATAVSVYKEEDLKNKCGEYCIIHGRIFDIQNYIYHGINSNVKKPMQRIFTRSFLISLVNILIPNMLVKKINLYTFNILFCGGGTFTVLIPNEYKIIEKAKNFMNEISKKVGELFNNKIYLEYEVEKIGLKTDNDRTRYEKGFKKASMNLYEKKYNRSIINLIYDDFKEYKKCKNCGINYAIDNKNKTSNICTTCELEDKWINITKNNSIENFYIDYNNVTLEDIKNPEKFTQKKIKKGTPIICFSYDQGEKIKSEYPIIDVYDIGKTCIRKRYDKCEKCYGKDVCDGPLKDDSDTNQLVSLDCFSYIIATAKIDVDDFQFLLYHVYPRKSIDEVYNFSISRLANTSSLFNLFFSMHLRRIIEDKFKDSVMILYAGGDDIMITGNWEDVVSAVLSIKEEMIKFTNASTGNDNITITAGILFHNSKKPFNLVVQGVGQLLEKGKDNGKDCVNLNGNILSFDNLKDVSYISTDLVKDKLEKKIINRSLLFKMQKLIKMISSEDDIEKMRAYAMYNYLINSEIKEKKFDENKDKDIQIKKEISQILESFIINDKKDYKPGHKYAKEKSIIEFAIRKSRERRNSNEL